MATPESGAISMNDMRTHINRATTSSISMSEMRTRYGGSGQISFSDLRKCEGFTINPTRYNTGGKFSSNIDGWQDGLFGSVSPDEGDGRVQFAANSWLYYASENDTYTAGTTTVGIEPTSTSAGGGGDSVTAGYKVTNVSRMVFANSSVSISNPISNSTYSTFDASYNMPTSGTIHCLIKF